MQARGLIMLVIAVVLGGAAVLLVNKVLTDKVSEQAASDSIATQPLVVAAVDLQVGTRLKKDMLKVVDWPETAVIKDSFTDPAVVIGEDPEKAPVVIKEMRIGEPVLKYKLSTFGARAGLASRIPDGFRAMTMDTNEIKGVAGFILPGDRVDLLHTSNEYRKDKKPATRMLLQNIKVLAVDQASSENVEKPKVANAVTVLVTTDQGEKITLARRVGEISLMLRNEGDHALSAGELLSVTDLKGMEQEPVVETLQPAAKPVPKKVVRRTSSLEGVQVIKGLSISKQSVKKESAPAGAEATSNAK